KLLLIAQHFQGGFSEDRKIKRRFFDRGIGKNNLMRQRGLAATRRARDNIERKFRDAASHDFIEAGHAGGYFADDDFRRSRQRLGRKVGFKRFHKFGKWT